MVGGTAQPQLTSERECSGSTPRLVLLVQVFTCRTQTWRDKGKGVHVGKQPCQGNPSTEENPKQLSRTRGDCHRKRGGRESHFPHGCLSIWSCARPCAKASGAFAHLIPVTSMTEMKTEDFKGQQPAREPLPVRLAFRASGPHLHSLLEGRGRAQAHVPAATTGRDCRHWRPCSTTVKRAGATGPTHKCKDTCLADNG